MDRLLYAGFSLSEAGHPYARHFEATTTSQRSGPRHSLSWAAGNTSPLRVGAVETRLFAGLSDVSLAAFGVRH
jgi:hypothetical protein